MPIQFVVKFSACLALAGASLISTAQQTTPPANSDSSAQTQSSSQQSSPQQGQTSQSPATPDSSQPASSQQTSPQAADKDKNKDKNNTQTDGQGKVVGTSNDRLFYALPNFLTLERGNHLPPLSPGAKFKVVALGTFDPIQFPWWGIIAGISQAENSEPAYGQGWVSYAKRYGSTAGDSIIENFMVGAVYPSILHQDPRFYYEPNGKFPHRVGYAISRIFVTRSDSGHAQFNFSEILGAATAAAISTNTYHPRGTYIEGKYISSERTLTNTATVWGTQLGLDTITIVIKEFWPDVHRKIAKKHKADAPPSPAP